MKHFLDLGSHKFEGLRQFCQQLLMDGSWSVRCYEANPLVYKEALISAFFFKRKFRDFKFFNRAVLDRNGTVIFHCHKGAWTDSSKKEFTEGYTVGSNALENTPECDIANGRVFRIVDMEVPCVDINDILDDICKADDQAEIYIKCDIEGSEFRVLPRMLRSKYIRNVKQLYVEWHERFWYKDGMEEKLREKATYINRLRELNVEYFLHDNVITTSADATPVRQRLSRPLRRFITRMKLQHPTLFRHH